MSLVHVVDARSNKNDNIDHAAEFLSRSAWRRKVFREIYRGKPKAKTAESLATKLKASHKRVLMAGNELHKAGLVEQLKVESRVAYRKEGFLDQYKVKILRLAEDPVARKNLPTKTRPVVGGQQTIRLQLSRKLFRVKEITVDDIASFDQVRKIKKASGARLALPESVFKEGIKRIIGEPGRFVDNPAEKFDLLSTRLVLKADRIAAAFAFKGPGQKGLLRPSSMGRNGDQIQRLFHSEARVFVLQYWDQIDESVVEQMRMFATVRSVHTGDQVFYGVIDGQDSDRLVAAYPQAFKSKRKKGA